MTPRQRRLTLVLGILAGVAIAGGLLLLLRSERRRYRRQRADVARMGEHQERAARVLLFPRHEVQAVVKHPPYDWQSPNA